MSGEWRPKYTSNGDVLVSSKVLIHVKDPVAQVKGQNSNFFESDCAPQNETDFSSALNAFMSY